MKTLLSNRTLWYDGMSEISSEQIEEFLSKGISAKFLAVDKITEDIQRFNEYSEDQIQTKSSLNNISPIWVLPEEYKYLDLETYLNSLVDHISITDKLFNKRISRLAEEIDLFFSLGYHDLLKTLIYIIAEFKSKNIIWGVGRGSSCASYLLYLLGLHSVDPVKYDIPITEFIKRK